MVNNLFIFVFSLILVIKGAIISTKFAAKLARSLNISEYTAGFIIVAIISILPETFISINSSLTDMPSFGLGVLFGSNIADLTLIFAILVFYAGRGIKIERKILKNNSLYPFILLLPIILGLDGYFSRIEGAALIIVGLVFYYMAFKDGHTGRQVLSGSAGRDILKNTAMLLVGMAVLLLGAHFTVSAAVDLSGSLGVDSILLGMLIIGLGTTIPELFFSMKSVKKEDDPLAVGDILGTVLADATIVVGILAVVSPFIFPKNIIYITGMFMVGAAFILMQLMRTGKTLSRGEAVVLFLYWLTFVVVEFMVAG